MRQVGRLVKKGEQKSSEDHAGDVASGLGQDGHQAAPEILNR